LAKFRGTFQPSPDGTCRKVAGIEVVKAPKVLARHLHVAVNGSNEVFLLPDWRVASLIRQASEILRNKIVDSRITDKALHGYGIAEHSRR
jgi:hypothetical protein